MPAFWQELTLQVCFQLSIHQAHGNLTDPVIVLRVKPCPGTVHGNEACQGTGINEPHRQVGSFVSVPAAVQDALRSIPDRTADDRIMMVRLVVLVLLPGILSCLMILE